MNGSTLSAFPKGPFSIIYADPPWAYKGGAGIKGGYTREQQYPTMTVDAICSLPVAECAAADCLLFLWITSPDLPKAFRVGEAWGFKYITLAFAWDKQKPIIGRYTMSQCELCLLFKRGRIPQPRGARNVRQFLSERSTRHSAKPDEVRKRIEAMFPTQRKLELFARAPAEGWTVWGNEADGIRG